MKPINVYLYKNCSTCKKALQFLKIQNIVFCIKEITETTPSKEEFKRMLGFLGGDVKKLFNTSGMLYKELQLKDKLPGMPLNEALTLLSDNGMLVKRPFIIGEDFGVVGFNEQRLADWIQIKK